MIEMKYELTYTNPALNEFVQACDLGISGVERVAIMTLKIKRDISEIDDDYINKLAKHIEALPKVDGYKVSKAIYVGVKQIVD